MIGKLSELTLDATFFALNYEQLAWGPNDEAYARLRDEANRLLSKMEISARIPKKQERLLEARELISGQVSNRLADERQRILGDTVALPMYFLHSFTYRVAAIAPFGEDWQQYREFIEECIDDLGIPVRMIDHLERELGLVIIETDDIGEPSITYVDALKAGGSFLQRVWEEFAKKEDSIQGNRRIIELMGEIRSEVQDFRDEYRQNAHILMQLVQEKNAEVLALMHDIQEQLILSGVAKADAKALTENDPEGLWDRVMKWVSGAPWADVTEEALWAALDFVPAGTGVKLGIKVSKAVRKALKKQ